MQIVFFRLPSLVACILQVQSSIVLTNTYYHIPLCEAFLELMVIQLVKKLPSMEHESSLLRSYEVATEHCAQSIESSQYTFFSLVGWD